MAWLDDRLRDHPKIIRASAPAFRHWALALCYCSAHGTAGRLDEAVLALNVPRKTVDELVHLKLWDLEPDGLWVHDWQEHNTQRDQKVDDRRAQARERARRYRARVRGEDPGDVTQTNRDEPRDEERDGSVTRTRDVTRDERDCVTRDAVRDLRARARDHDQGSTKEEPPAAAHHERDAAAAAAETIRRLEHLGLDLTISTDLEHADPDLVTAWLDLADQEADTNAAGFVLAGVRSGRPPSPRVRAQDQAVVDPVGSRRAFVEGHGWRLAADHLDDELAQMGADEDERTGLLELAADLRRGAAA